MLLLSSKTTSGTNLAHTKTGGTSQRPLSSEKYIIDLLVVISEDTLKSGIGFVQQWIVDGVSMSFEKIVFY